MKQFILVWSLLIVHFFSFAQTSEEKKVTEALLNIHKAIFVDKNVSTLESNIANVLTYGHSGGKIEDRKEMIENIANSKSVYSNMNATVLSVNVQGKTAVTRYLLTGTETKPDGKSTELKLNILQVWVKEKKGWKMMARQAVKVS